jgi:hypothetical protein
MPGTAPDRQDLCTRLLSEGGCCRRRRSTWSLMQKFSIEGMQLSGTLPPEYATWGGSLTTFSVSCPPRRSAA